MAGARSHIGCPATCCLRLFRRRASRRTRFSSATDSHCDWLCHDDEAESVAGASKRSDNERHETHDRERRRRTSGSVGYFLCISDRRHSQLSFIVRPSGGAGSDRRPCCPHTRVRPAAVPAERTRGPAKRLRGKEPTRDPAVARGDHGDRAELDADGEPALHKIYGSYELNINLGSDFRRGTTYSVSVNDKRTTFVAQ
jgi:hypothetical protein